MSLKSFLSAVRPPQNYKGQLGLHLPYPKDPSVLKIVRRANSLRREENCTATAKRYGECSEVLVFLGKRGRKTVRIVKYYGGS